MQTKLEQVSALLEQTAREVSADSEKWAAFLSTAARMYKYSVDDQLLIHTQYPDATACAAISVWNKLKRWVKRGTKGIALLEQNGDQVRLKYVFNVSDTQAGRGGKDVHLWQLGEEHTDTVGRILSANFGVKTDGELSARLLDAAEKAARDTCRVYFPDLMKSAEGSRLAGMRPTASPCSAPSCQRCTSFPPRPTCVSDTLKTYFRRTRPPVLSNRAIPLVPRFTQRLSLFHTEIAAQAVASGYWA